MILYDLRCGKDHGFEGWFRDSKAYDSQRRGGRVVCPICGDKKVRKAPMAPRLSKGAVAKSGKGPTEAEALTALREMRKQVEANCDYVGPNFAEEARKIHYGETEKRGIYGEASESDSKDLADEGIEVGRIPWVPLADN
ncbi:MAG: DUF1178 family protein [Rhodospirillaceae bacterium]|nr:DUF1178 family protein [Rhodospirillaceae bacterium]